MWAVEMNAVLNGLAFGHPSICYGVSLETTLLNYS